MAVPAADLVEDHQAARRGLGENGGGLDHLHHEGRAAPGQVVAGADAAEQPVDHPQAQALRRHEAAGLGQHRQQRVLAQEGRLAGHVRAGDDRQPRPADARAVQAAVVGGEGVAGPAHGGLDHRMARGLGLEGGGPVDDRAAARRRRRPIRPGRRRHRGWRRPGRRPGSARRRRWRPRARPRRCRARWPAPARRPGRSCASSSASSTVVKRTWLARVWRWMKVALSGGGHQRLGRLGRGLDEIAEDGVVADLQRPRRSRRRAGPPGRRSPGGCRRAAPGPGRVRAARRRRRSRRRGPGPAGRARGRRPAGRGRPPGRPKARQVQGRQGRRRSRPAGSPGGRARRRTGGRPPRPVFRPSRSAPRSRGPPRPSASRDRPRAMSPAAPSARRAASGAGAGARRTTATASRRASMAAGSSSGRASRAASMRAPARRDAAVDGRQQRAVARPPEVARSISRLVRVAGSMIMTSASPARRGGERAGSRPAWVISRWAAIRPSAEISAPDSGPKPSRVSTP